jgi:high-affinity nickel-transport protein
MALFPRGLTSSFDRGEWIRLALFYGAIVALHIVGWGILLSEAPQYPALVGLGALAYSFGLRHAFDADHISAIDDTTRKLLQQGKRPVGVGFFFSFGHSTVVLLIALALGFAVHTFVDSVVSDDGQLRNIGGLIGTSVSGTFLLVMGTINLVILLDILSTFRRMRRGELDRQSLEQNLVQGGVLTRAFAGLFKFINASWQMYFVGFLFGLGFDTASEVALLAISAGAATQGLPFVAIVSLPLIFAAGMSLMDMTDGAFMAKAYSWAFSNPIRKIFYNVTMTGLSVFIALFIGTLEILQIVSQIGNFDGGAWNLINNFDLNTVGFMIVIAFAVTWISALTWFKMAHVEERWTVLIDR